MIHQEGYLVADRMTDFANKRIMWALFFKPGVFKVFAVREYRKCHKLEIMYSGAKLWTAYLMGQCVARKAQ